jgi:hypothetical protein
LYCLFSYCFCGAAAQPHVSKLLHRGPRAVPRPSPAYQHFLEQVRLLGRQWLPAHPRSRGTVLCDSAKNDQASAPRGLLAAQRGDVVGAVLWRERDPCGCVCACWAAGPPGRWLTYRSWTGGAGRRAAAYLGEYAASVLFLFLAALFDGLDGHVARLLHGTTPVPVLVPAPV